MINSNELKIFHPIQVDNLKRLGSEYDGGYIVHYPSLSDAEYLISYGVGNNIDFEKDFYRETGRPTIAFDPTLKDYSHIFSSLLKFKPNDFIKKVKSYIEWMRKEASLEKYNIRFIEEGLSATNASKYKTLMYHFNQYNILGKKNILKIDIEGGEYEVFNDHKIFNTLSNTVQIIIEFHYLDKHMSNLIEIFQKISETHSLIHIHANNYGGTFEYNEKKIPYAFEATFLLNIYLPNKAQSLRKYPIVDLDKPCLPNKEDIQLNFFVN